VRERSTWTVGETVLVRKPKVKIPVKGITLVNNM